MTALRGIRVIELAERVSGEYCGKLLADFAADVIKIERPRSGSPTRSMAPILRESAAPEGSGLFAYLNTNKQSVVLDLSTQAGVDELHALIAAADAVIDDHDEAWLSRLRLSAAEVTAAHPEVVFCSITPLGQGAPSDWRNAQSLNVLHRSGWGYHTPTAADPSKPPLKGPGRFLVDYDAGLDAAMCVVSALLWRRHSQRGQFIDVSQQAVMVSRADSVLGRMLAGDDPVGKERTRYDQGGPHGFFRCSDGAVYLYMTSAKHWKGLCELLGHPQWTRELREDWLEFAATDDAVAQCRAGFAEWVRDKEKDTVSDAAQRLGVPLVPVQNAADVYRSRQFIHRGFFQSVQHPVLGEALYPTVPYKLSASPARLTRSAPRLGEHTAEVLAQALDAWRRRATRENAGAPVDSRQGPLAGIRVVEMTKVWAGPHAGKLLAFLGAEVIKVESRANLDEMRAYGGVDPDHAPWFLSLNPCVQSVQINLKCSEGLELLKALIAKSDVLMNNLRPGAMERAGLGYDALRAIKHDIISVSIKMFGNDGPLGHQTGYAPSFAALGGLNHLVGYEGEPPSGMNMRYGDSTVGAVAAFATTVALMHRARTGEGQFVDVSAVECMSSVIGDCLLEFAMTGNSPQPDGNRHPDMAPHGCYPCRDGDWLSLAVTTDAEWRTLCECLGRDALASEARFATLAQRQAHRRELDELLSVATSNHAVEPLAACLRAAGVAACKSQNSLDLVQDPLLWERHVFTHVPDHRNGSRPIVGRPWRMSGTEAPIDRGAPRLGEHNRHVYCDILGLAPERLQALVDQGIVY